MDSFVTVIFSKNRAMQLNLLLETLQKHSSVDIEDLNVNVLYKADEKHEKSYENLKKMHKNVNFCQEKWFKDDFLSFLVDKKWILFLCDDTIFTGDFDLEKIVERLSDSAQTIGFSLRLGLNTEYCYSLDIKQKLKKYFPDWAFIGWEWPKEEGDYSYPLEVSSSIFKTKDIIAYLQMYLYSGPNALEWALYQSTPDYFNSHPYLMSYRTSVAFCNPINKVQDTNNNRAGTYNHYNPESLLNMWEEGYKIDPDFYDGYISNGAHEEVELKLVRR